MSTVHLCSSRKSSPRKDHHYCYHGHLGDGVIMFGSTQLSSIHTAKVAPWTSILWMQFTPSRIQWWTWFRRWHGLTVSRKKWKVCERSAVPTYPRDRTRLVQWCANRVGKKATTLEVTPFLVAEIANSRETNSRETSEPCRHWPGGRGGQLQGHYYKPPH